MADRTAARSRTRLDWQRVRDVASRLTTPLHPDDYLSLINPLWIDARAARAGREGGPGDRRRRDPGDPAGLGLVATTTSPGSTSASACRSTGKFHWRSYSLSSPPRARRRHDRDHRAGDARGLPVRRTWSAASSRAPSCGWPRPTGDFVLPDPPPARIAVPGRRQRHHPGDGDAAHAGPARHDARRRPALLLAAPRTG